MLQYIKGELLTAPLQDHLDDEAYLRFLLKKYGYARLRPEDIGKLSEKNLALIYAQEFLTPEQVELNVSLWDEERAPPDLIDADLRYTKDELFYPRDQRLLEIRASPGRAHSGHGQYCVKDPKSEDGKFHPYPCPNTTIEDIVARSEYDIDAFYDLSLKLVLEAVEPILYFFEEPYKTKLRLHNQFNKPVQGFEFLINLDLDPIEFMRGFYFGAHMDDFDGYRRDVAKKYGHQMGGGDTYAIDLNVLRTTGISLNELAHQNYRNRLLDLLPHSTRLKLFRGLGLIVSGDGPTSFETVDDILGAGELAGGTVKGGVAKEIINVYIREEKGPGVADDLAVVLSSFLPTLDRRRFSGTSTLDWFSRMMGTFMADYIDTVEKAVPYIVPGGLDQAFGDMVQAKYQALCQDYRFREIHGIAERKDGNYRLVAESVMHDFIAASANTPGGDIIHSSQRYFRRIHRDQISEGVWGSPTCTLRELILYTQRALSQMGRVFRPVLRRGPEEKEPEALRIGFNRIPWNKVKSVLYNRIALINSPQDREQSLHAFYDHVLSNGTAPKAASSKARPD